MVHGFVAMCELGLVANVTGHQFLVLKEVI